MLSLFSTPLSVGSISLTYTLCVYLLFRIGFLSLIIILNLNYGIDEFQIKNYQFHPE